MPTILAINGSYRDDGVTDQLISRAEQLLQRGGATVEVIQLRDYSIEFCLNCRECTQLPGDRPGQCVHNDGMQNLIEKIEAADSLILACPTNVGTVTALFKRFMERLTVYAYWPWGEPAPVLRKTQKPTKRLLVISSCAAPAWMGRWLFKTLSQLRRIGTIVGAKVVGSMMVGFAATAPHQQLPEDILVKVEKEARKLLPASK